MITLITGGARSGKSAYAELLAEQSGLHVVYLATARAGDEEMGARIHQHRERRPGHWLTVEEPLALGAALQRHAAADRFVVLDCLTLWLSNLMLVDHREEITQAEKVAVIEPGPVFVSEREAFLRVLADLPGQLAVISNEVGMGVVPLGALSRFFVDEAGRLNQAVAAKADRLILMVAGCPLVAKGGELPC